MHSVAAAMMRSPRQAPAGAAATPEASATATPPIAMRTPAVLRAVKASMPSAAPAAMVISGSIESASVPRAGVAQGEIVEDEEHREEQDAERRDRDPVAPARP